MHPAEEQHVPVELGAGPLNPDSFAFKLSIEDDIVLEEQRRRAIPAPRVPA